MTTPRTTSRNTYVGAGSIPVPARQRVSPELIASLATRLTPRDTWLLEMLHEHRVLTTQQICQLAFPSMSTTTHRLLRLWRSRAVERFRPATATGSAPMHYVLGPAGAAILATRRDMSVARFGYRIDRALAVAHSDKLAHLVGSNGIFTALAAHSRTHPGSELALWWSERRAQSIWGKVTRPDGYGRWREHDDEIDFFLEYDTGTEPLPRLLTKIADYGALAEMTGITDTPVLFVLPGAAREDHLHARLTPGVQLIATTMLDALSAAGGPAGPAWRPADSHQTRRPLIALARRSPARGHR